MKRITCYLDFISPYAYLAFERLPEALEGLSCVVDYRPILFGAVLKHHGQLGPAEIPTKREWTYRQVLWLGHTMGVPLDLPASHPFNPLALLRLALATGDDGCIGRHVARTIFRHVWRGGGEAGDATRLAELQRQLQPRADPAGDTVRGFLRSNTDDAIAQGVFGVPSFAVDGRLYWGLDSLPMLRAALCGDAWFDGPAWVDAAMRPGVQRIRN